MSGAPGAVPAGQVEVRASGPLQAAEAGEVLQLVQEATDADGVGPLSEHVLLSVRYGRDKRARNVRVWESGRLGDRKSVV